MAQVVEFNHERLLLEKARQLLNTPLLLHEKRDSTLSCLLQAIKYADTDLRHKIVILLSGFAGNDLVWPLLEIMTDKQESDEHREQAALYINFLAPFITDSQQLTDRLLALLSSENEENRVLSIMTLGWEGNLAASFALVDCLYDSSIEIQEIAAISICNLKDNAVFSILEERIMNGSFDQKRAILYGISRFSDSAAKVRGIYRHELEYGDPRLKFDILLLLKHVEKSREDNEIYMGYLDDENERVRSLAIERLGEAGLISREMARNFLGDSSMEVKRAAMKILHQLKTS